MTRKVGKYSATIDRQERRLECVFYLILLVLPLFLCGGLMWIPYQVNNQKLEWLAEQLYAYPLPPSTEVISRHQEIALLGNGNHCNYVVEQVLATLSDPKEIEKHYTNAKFLSVDKRKRYSSYETGNSPTFLNADVVITGEQFSDGRQKVIVGLVDVGNDPGFDIRCH